MKALTAFLLLCGLQCVWSRSRFLQHDTVCEDVDPETLVIKDDEDSCGMFIACVGRVAQRFKCFSDSVYSNGTAICLACNEYEEDFYTEDDPYGKKKATKKKFTYKQTQRTKTTRTYDRKTTVPRQTNRK